MDPPRDNPGVIAPPPLVFAGFLLVGLALDWLTGLDGIRLSFAARAFVAALLLAAAIGLLVDATGRFRRAGTRLEPWRPSTALVTSGAYRYSRNPIYLGMALAYGAIALAANAVLALLLLAPALLVIEYGVIRREERYLSGKFGDPYLRYKATVRRWL